MSLRPEYDTVIMSNAYFAKSTEAIKNQIKVGHICLKLLTKKKHTVLSVPNYQASVTVMQCQIEMPCAAKDDTSEEEQRVPEFYRF